MYKMDAIYQPIFNFDLSLYNTTEEDGRVTIHFKDKNEVDSFLNSHNLEERSLSNGMLLAVTKEEEPNIYGRFV